MSPSDFPPGGIVLPALDSMPTVSAASYLGLRLPPGTEWYVPSGTTLPAVKRNAGVAWFLDRPHLSWCWFLDADHVLEPDTLLRLLAHRVPVVSALAFGRIPPHRLMAWETPTRPLGRVRVGLQPVHHVGAACLVVRREVLAAMQPPYFEGDSEGRGEDVRFCARVIEAGFPLMADTNVIIGHVSTLIVNHAYIQHWEKYRASRHLIVGPLLGRG